jgi:hypothetical protein
VRWLSQFGTPHRQIAGGLLNASVAASLAQVAGFGRDRPAPERI